MPAETVLRTGAGDAGTRLDLFLAGHAGSRAAAQRLIEDGRVTVDGAPRAKRHVLAAGAEVRVAAAPEAAAPPAAEPPAFAVAWEDPHVLVVDKPAGVVVHPAPGHHGVTLAEALAGRVAGGEDPSRAGVVHRLDRDTSGLLLFARTEPAHAALKAQLGARTVLREYLALVAGRPPALAGTIDAPIGRDRRVRTRMSTETDEPRAAVTHFEVERPLPAATLLRARLETGRTHQVRAHLKAIGHPVLGDRDYGVPGALGLERQFLHAHRLGFRHPASGEWVELRSPLPADLAAALERASYT